MKSTNSISKLVGFHLKKLRIQSGLTAFQLAKQAGIKSEQQLYRYEMGINRIGIDELISSLQVLDIDIGEFFELITKESLVENELTDIDKEKQYLDTQIIITSSSHAN